MASLRQFHKDKMTKSNALRSYFYARQHVVISRGVDPYGTGGAGGTRPPQYLDRGDMITNVPPIFLE